ncbi:MAG TPA: NADH-quinone oxidoreductase subunit NuoH [Actinomycetota bacterium]|nr:NADH-quinone oxidoreductase subunit NuoH [Actinomycetota bacterium]
MSVTVIADFLVILVKVLVVFMVLSLLVVFIVWFERKVVAHMQSRIGPNRWGPYGLLTSLADGIKLFFKEGIVPTSADRVLFLAAPAVAVGSAFLAFAAIPFGTHVVLFNRTIEFQITDLNVGLLWVLAMGSLAVYGVVLAGWASGSKYPLLGGIRSSAQMISYEIALSLSLVPVIMSAGTLSLRGIVEHQAGSIGRVNWLGPASSVGKVLPHWYIFYHLPAFIIFLLAGVAETNRPPFDLAEADTELVGGFHTEYSGIKFAMFYLAEYLHVVTIGAVAVLMFLGGWQGPHITVLAWLWPLAYFVIKVFLFVFLFVWLRATLPRLRYDRLMEVGWKVLIPASLAWLVLAGAAMVGGI